MCIGYATGVTGGVSAMPQFLKMFFPEIAAKQARFKSKSAYCLYSSIELQTVTSIAYLGALGKHFISESCK